MPAGCQGSTLWPSAHVDMIQLLDAQWFGPEKVVVVPLRYDTARQTIVFSAPIICFEDGEHRADHEQLWHVRALVASSRKPRHHQQAIRLLRKAPWHDLQRTGVVHADCLAKKTRAARPMESATTPSMEDRDDSVWVSTAVDKLLCQMESIVVPETFCPSSNRYGRSTHPPTWQRTKRCAATGGKIGLKPRVSQQSSSMKSFESTALT